MLNEKKFQAIYNEFQESSLTIRDYCSNQHMNEAKFYYWKNKLKDLLPPKKGFVPLVFEADKQGHLSHLSDPVNNGVGAFPNRTTVDKTIYCEISYPNGVCLKLNGLSDIEDLQSLLHLTHQQNV